MDKKKNVTSNKNIKSTDKSQVRDTAGGEMPDPNQKRQGPTGVEVQNAFNTTKTSKTHR